MEGKIDIKHTNGNDVLIELQVTNGQNKKITLILYHIRFCLNYIEVGNITGFEFQHKELDPHKSEKILTVKFFISPFVLDMIEIEKEKIEGIHSGGTGIELLYVFDEDKNDIHREKINLDDYKFLSYQWNDISSKMIRFAGEKLVERTEKLTEHYEEIVKQTGKLVESVETIAGVIKNYGEDIKSLKEDMVDIKNRGEDITSLKEDMVDVKNNMHNIREKLGLNMTYMTPTSYDRFKQWFMLTMIMIKDICYNKFFIIFFILIVVYMLYMHDIIDIKDAATIILADIIAGFILKFKRKKTAIIK